MPPRKSKTAAAAAAKPETPAVVGRRRSQRVSTSASASTDKKSRYFTAESEGSEAELDVKATPAPKKRGRPSGSASAKKAPPAKRVKKAAVESEEEEEAGETPFEESQPEEEEEEEEEEVKPVKKAARGRKAKVVIHQDKGEKANVGKRRVAKQVADSDAEDAVPTKKPGRPAAKKTQPPTDDDEEDDDSDARPKVVFIPHAKIRDDGGVPYTDDLVHPNTLEFLKDLKANNVRSWLKCTPPPHYPNPSPLTPPPPANDGEFRRALKDWESYATALTDTIIDLDPTIPELPFKDINFRIYRDIRFTNDPTPYKVPPPPPFAPPTPSSLTPVTATLLRRLVPHRPQRPLRLLLFTHGTQPLVLHSRRPLAPLGPVPRAPARLHRRAPRPLASRPNQPFLPRRLLPRRLRQVQEEERKGAPGSRGGGLRGGECRRGAEDEAKGV